MKNNKKAYNQYMSKKIRKKKRHIRKSTLILSIVAASLSIILVFTFGLLISSQDSNKKDIIIDNKLNETVYKYIQDANIESSGIVYKDVSINDVATLSITIPSEEKQPLVIVLPGFQTKKEDMIHYGTTIAKNGYYVVILDLIGFGENITDEDLGFYEIINETSKAIDTIFPYLKTLEQVDTTKFALSGFSLGGMTTYYYAINGKYKPSLLIPMSSTFDWTTMQDSYLNEMYVNNGEVNDYPERRDEVLNYINRFNPANGINELVTIPIFASHGELDKTIPIQYDNELFSNLQSLGATDVTLVIYPDLEHGMSNDFTDRVVEKLNTIIK